MVPSDLPTFSTLRASIERPTAPPIQITQMPRMGAESFAEARRNLPEMGTLQRMSRQIERGNHPTS